METVKIKFTNRDLVERFGLYMDVKYDWAMQQVKEGRAEIYNPPNKNDNNGHKPPANLSIPLPQQQTVVAATESKIIKKYPNIVWVQDSNFMGGAELSSQQVINVGGKLGFDIYTLTPQNFDLGILRNAKLLIINNIWTFGLTQMVEIKRAIFEFQVPYIKYEHDMREAVNNDRLSFSRRLFKNSKMNVFISPLQLREYQNRIYDMSPCHTFPLAIDVDKFKPNPDIKRDMKKIVHTSGNLHNKGHQKLLAMTKQRPDMKFEIFVGQNKLITQMFAGQKNVKLRTRIAIDEMPDVYSSAGYLVHVPVGVWAGERVVLEAALCGCKLIINDNVGHKSWGWDLEDIEALRGELKRAPYEFWRAVEKVL